MEDSITIKENETQNEAQSLSKNQESLMDKCDVLFDKEFKDPNNLNSILENEKIMKLINDPEINEANLQKELNRIDNQFDNHIDKLNKMEEYSSYFLENLDKENSKKLKKIDEENPENEKNEDFDEEEKKKNQEKELQERKVLNMDIILKAIYFYEKTNPNFKENLSKDEEKELLINLETLLLNDKKISKINSLDIFDKLQELYLQRNFIMKIEGLNYLRNLEVLSLNNNFIKKIENLSHLKTLRILDLSDNLIDNFQIEEIPKNLNYLYLFDNLFYDKEDLFAFRSICVTNLPELIRLDHLNISDNEKMFICNFNTKKLECKSNLNLKKKLKYISDHYSDMKKDRRKTLNEYMDQLNKSNFSLESNLHSNNLTSSTIKFDNESNNTSSIKESANLVNENNNNFPTENSENFDNISTKNNSVKGGKPQNLAEMTNELITYEQNLIKSERNQINITGLDSDLISNAKERSRQRKLEFQKEFDINSLDVKDNLNDVKNKFQEFKHRFDNLKFRDMESKLKERINFDERLGKVDEKIGDIDILSKNLGAKISEIKNKIDDDIENMKFANY